MYVFFFIGSTCHVNAAVFFFKKNHLLIGNRRGKGEKEGGFRKNIDYGDSFLLFGQLGRREVVSESSRGRLKKVRYEKKSVK